MKKISFLILFISLSLSIISALPKKKDKNIEKNTESKSYLIIIAIDEYQNRLPLNRCLKEATDFKNTIYANYNFDEMIEIYDKDATIKNITDNFKNLQKIINENDSILIYYNGHGYIDPLTNEGYWIVHDSGINEQLKENWLSNTDFVKLLDKIKAKHVALICESSFSAKFLIEEEKKILKEDDEYFKTAYEKKSSLILSSGKNETGFEQSEMTDQIIKALKFNKKPLIDLQIIYNDIKFKVKESKVFFGHFKDINYEIDGGFVFFLRENPVDMKEYEAKKNIDKTEEDKNQDKDKIVKKEKDVKIITQTQPDTLKILNRTSLVFLITGSTFTLFGAGVFIYDVVVQFEELRRYTTNPEEYNNYIQYEQAYNRNLIIFCSSVSVLAAGICLLAASLSLRIYVVVKKKQLSLNINFKQNLELSASIKF